MLPLYLWCNADAVKLYTFYNYNHNNAQIHWSLRQLLSKSSIWNQFDGQNKPINSRSPWLYDDRAAGPTSISDTIDSGVSDCDCDCDLCMTWQLNLTASISSHTWTSSPQDSRDACFFNWQLTSACPGFHGGLPQQIPFDWCLATSKRKSSCHFLSAYADIIWYLVLPDRDLRPGQ